MSEYFLQKIVESIRNGFNDVDVGTFAARVHLNADTMPEELKNACPNWDVGELVVKVRDAINGMTEARFDAGAWKLVGGVLYECYHCKIDLDELPAAEVSTTCARLKSCYLKNLGQVWKTYEGVYPRNNFLPIGILTVVSQLGQQMKKKASDEEKLSKTQKRPINSKSLTVQMDRTVELKFLPVECQTTQGQMDAYQLEAERKTNNRLTLHPASFGFSRKIKKIKILKIKYFQSQFVETTLAAQVFCAVHGSHLA